MVSPLKRSSSISFPRSAHVHSCHNVGAVPDFAGHSHPHLTIIVTFVFKVRKKKRQFFLYNLVFVTITCHCGFLPQLPSFLTLSFAPHVYFQLNGDGERF